jgi:hypothetical protein
VLATAHLPKGCGWRPEKETQSESPRIRPLACWVALGCCVVLIGSLVSLCYL